MDFQTASFLVCQRVLIWWNGFPKLRSGWETASQVSSWKTVPQQIFRSMDSKWYLTPIYSSLKWFLAPLLTRDILVVGRKQDDAVHSQSKRCVLDGLELWDERTQFRATKETFIEPFVFGIGFYPSSIYIEIGWLKQLKTCWDFDDAHCRMRLKIPVSLPYCLFFVPSCFPQNLKQFLGNRWKVR